MGHSLSIACKQPLYGIDNYLSNDTRHKTRMATIQDRLLVLLDKLKVINRPGKKAAVKY